MIDLSVSDVISALGITVTLASVATAATPTPDPEKHPYLAKGYRVIEVLALVVGKAKDMGYNVGPRKP